MLKDSPRTKAYEKAIMDNKEWIKDKVVMGKLEIGLALVFSWVLLFGRIRCWCWHGHPLLVLLARWCQEGLRGGGKQDG